MRLKHLTIFTVIFLAACASPRQAIQNQDTVATEYVQRIAKKIVLVSSRPNAKYSFYVTDESKPSMRIVRRKSVILSKGLLQDLNDEAELAAVLAMAISESESINYMARAGYDPQAVIDLQQRFMLNQAPWLKAIYPKPIADIDLSASQDSVNNAPLGLYRGQEGYSELFHG